MSIDSVHLWKFKHGNQGKYPPNEFAALLFYRDLYEGFAMGFADRVKWPIESIQMCIIGLLEDINVEVEVPFPIQDADSIMDTLEMETIMLPHPKTQSGRNRLATFLRNEWNNYEI